MNALDHHLFALVVNSQGHPQPAIMGLDYDNQQPLALTFNQIKRIKHADPFRLAVLESLKLDPERFSRELFYDGYPLHVIWRSTDVFSGYVHILNANAAAQSITYLTCTTDPVDKGTSNVFEGLSYVEDFPGLLERYAARPLSLTFIGLVTDGELAIASKLSSSPAGAIGFNDQDDPLISAARLAFSWAFFSQINSI